eukprot:gene1554-4702_t
MDKHIRSNKQLNTMKTTTATSNLMLIPYNVTTTATATASISKTCKTSTAEFDIQHYNDFNFKAITALVDPITTLVDPITTLVDPITTLVDSTGY